MNLIKFPQRMQNLTRYSDRFDAFKLAADNCDVLFAMYPAGTTIEPHQHDTDNYGVITRGKLWLIVDGEERCYGPGDWYHVPRHQVHAARFAEDTEEIEFWFQQ